MTTTPSYEDMALAWPSREVVAREIRRAMLDNPTDESFNKRAEKREAIANDVADVIMARFEATRTTPPATRIEQDGGLRGALERFVDVAHKTHDLAERTRAALAKTTRPPSLPGREAMRAEIIEEVATSLARWYPDNVSTNAFCAAVRSLITKGMGGACTCGGDDDQPASHHDISCPRALTPVTDVGRDRPSDCPNVMSCGWHHVRTEPEIGLYLCSTPNCQHMIQAAALSGTPSHE